MLSFNALGNLGRLGNQMFQYASLRGIAAHRGTEFCIPPRRCFGSKDPNVAASGITLYDAFNLYGLKYRKRKYLRVTVRERGFEFDAHLFDTCPLNANLYGYFQSERYFKQIESDIRRDFTFQNHIADRCKRMINEPNLVSVHVRRGDYVNNPHHVLQPVEYYQRAMNEFGASSCIVFSDDPQWCARQAVFADCVISDTGDAAVDLCLMSMCNGHIMGNSSFSWWGAWLANSRQVIAPANWFGHGYANMDMKDFYLKNWKLL